MDVISGGYTKDLQVWNYMEFYRKNIGTGYSYRSWFNWGQVFGYNWVHCML